ncbi:cytochrome P450 [Terriglobus tenax]|uniref:cytochrome P450 n=1 Tax=Terriglobus tenax TaxID=1111115 RepID=UPI0021DF64F0|nr:cytochrome P450 [Terriglobus tenax]
MSSTATLPVIERGGYRFPPGLAHNLPFYIGRKPWARIGRPILLFEHLAKIYGVAAHYRMMGTNIVFLNHPDFVQEVLVTQYSSFIRERTLRRMKILLGEGLLTSNEPRHMQQRRIVAPAFHRQRIAAYADEIVCSAAAMAEGWEPGGIVDIGASMMQLSLTIVARTLFASEVTDDVRAINDETNAIMGLYNLLVLLPKLESYLDWPLPGITRFRKARAHLDSVVYRIIGERRANPVDRQDLLSMLLLSRDEDGNVLSDEQVRDEVLTIFLAGYETTANALTWTWYLLSQNPDAREQMHAELDHVLGGRLPTLADYPNLPYTQQVFAESMRLYPPAWAMGRQAAVDVELGPYRFPAGTHVFFSQWMIQRNPEFYPDPLRFDPARHTEAAKAGRPKFAYFPFGGGARQCIGESFAWMEGILSLATMAQRWRLDVLPGQKIDVQEKITLRPRYPIMMRINARNP